MYNSKFMIEFFSGSKTVRDTFVSAGWTGLAIDINPNLKPDLVLNILDIKKEDISIIPDFMWFSIPCERFSRSAKNIHFEKETIKYRIYNYKALTPEANIALDIVKKVAEIISWFPKTPFVIENPVGRIPHILKDSGIGFNRYLINYADFGFKYSKETHIFTSLILPFGLKRTFGYPIKFRTVNNKLQRSKVPAKLVSVIINHIY